jgi:hypothetical protein
MVDVRRLAGGEETELAVTLDDLARESYTQMLWTGLRRKAAYLPG